MSFLICIRVDNYGVQFSDDWKTVIRGNTDLIEYIIPKTTVLIQDGTEDLNCFGSCTKLTNISFEEGSLLERIGKYAFIRVPLKFLDFSPCTKLKTISRCAFAYATIEEVVFSDSISSIEREAFRSTKISTVDFPLSLTSTVIWSFGYIKKLQTLIFRPESKLTSLGAESFSESGLRSLVIPSFITSMLAPFINVQLESIEIDPNNPNYYAKDGVVYTKDGLSIVFAISSIKRYECPSNITRINAHAFRASRLEEIILNEGLKTVSSYSMAFTKITSISIPNSVTILDSYLFSGCYKLESVTLSNNLTNISSYLFTSCEKLGSLVIPSGVQCLNMYCLQYCTSLSYLFIPATVYLIEGGAMKGINKTCQIVFEENGNMTHYGDLVYTADYKKLCVFLGVLGNSEITIDNRTETILGAVFLNQKVEKIKFENGSKLTKIEDEAFSGSSLISIELPDSVLNITSKVFSLCMSLKSIVLPKSLLSLGAECFSGSAIESIEIPNATKYILSNCFSQCKWLTKITFGGESALEDIGQEAFAGSSLKSIRIPKNLKNIGFDAFKGSNLTTIVFGMDCNVAEIWGFSFRDSLKLSEVSVQCFSITKIGESAFANCTSLKSFDLPISVESVSVHAFLGCTALSEFSIQAGSALTTIFGIAFLNCPMLTEIRVSAENDRFVFESGTLFDIDKTTAIMHLPNNKESEFVSPFSLVSIGMYAFQDCLNVESVTIGENVREIGMKAFDGCQNLKSLIIGEKLDSIIGTAFSDCESLQCGSVIYKTDQKKMLLSGGLSEESLSNCPTAFFTPYSQGEALVLSTLVHTLSESDPSH